MDALTAGVSLILVQICVAVIMTGVYFATPTEKATRYWALSGSLLAVGVLLAVLSRTGPMPLLLLGLTLVIAALTLQWQGIQLFYKYVPQRWNWAIALVFILLYCLLLILKVSPPYRAILFSSTMLVVFGFSLQTIFQGQGRKARSFVQWLVRGAIILLLASQIFKVIISSLQLLGYWSGDRSSAAIFTAYQVPLVGTVLFATGLLLLHFERTIEENRHLATHDELSKLLNRRAIVAIGQRELDLSMRLQRGLTLAFIDIDFFKLFNDEFGHDAGDTVLFDISRIFEETCRSIDVVGRYGGEEFLIIFPGANRADQYQIGERLLNAVHTYRFRNIHPVTISIGLATWDPDDDDCTWEQLMQRADTALYKAKDEGRDRYYAG